MRFATLRNQGFAFATTGTDFYLWSDYAKLFRTDKLVSQTRSFQDFLKHSTDLLEHLRSHAKEISQLKPRKVNESDYALPFTPLCFRDFCCFEEHVANARKGRGLEMIPEWYQAPIFYYSSHLSFMGPMDVVPYPQGSEELGFELEIGCVIGKEVRNASLEEAKKAIFGYCVLNDWTARDFQRFEMKVNMGPTKGKDFSTTFGSYIITPDELEAKRSGKGYDIEFELRVNDEVLVRNNWKKIHFSFEEMIVRGSKNCTMYPGEVIASGTMGRGCLMEQNIGAEKKRWLQKGETVSIRWLPDGPSVSNQIGEPV